MPAQSSVDRLPEAIRDALRQRMVESNFHGYDDLVAWLSDKGYELSRSAVHRDGQKVQRRIEKIRASTQAAQLIADAAPDQEDARSAAVIALVQSELFDAMLQLEEADEEADPAARIKLLSQSARAIAEASRASVSQKRWSEEVRKKDADRLAKMEQAAKGGKSGLDAETLRRVREEIYGIAA